MGRLKDDYRSLTGVDKAAIFMLSLSDAQASKMFEMMDDEEIKELSQAMANLGSVSSTNRRPCAPSSATLAR